MQAGQVGSSDDSDGSESQAILQGLRVLGIDMLVGNEGMRYPMHSLKGYNIGP